MIEQEEDKPLKSKVQYPKKIHVRFGLHDGNRLKSLDSRTMAEYIRGGLRKFTDLPYDQKWFYKEPYYREYASVPFQHIIGLDWDLWYNLEYYANLHARGVISDVVRASVRWQLATANVVAFDGEEFTPNGTNCIDGS